MNKLITVMQNFICTVPERLELVRRNTPKVAEVWRDCEFIVNYNHKENLEEIYSIYKENFPHLKFYNNLEQDWGIVTRSLLNEVKTPYVLYINEDQELYLTKQDWDDIVQEAIVENDVDYILMNHIEKYNSDICARGYLPDGNDPTKEVVLTPENAENLTKFMENIKNPNHPAKIHHVHVHGIVIYNWGRYPSPGYDEGKNVWFYKGKYAPHKRISSEAVYRTDFFIDLIQEFLEKGDDCEHEIPWKKKMIPNFYEGYYDFDNGMARFPDLKCAMAKNNITKQWDEVKQNRIWYTEEEKRKIKNSK